MAGLPLQVNKGIIDGYRLWMLTFVYISICDVYVHIYTCIYNQDGIYTTWLLDKTFTGVVQDWITSEYIIYTK